MSSSCPDCGASMLEEVAFCPGCGRDMTLRDVELVELARGRVGALSERVAGALVYTLLAAIVFLLVQPYSKNRFLRFHSLQCIGFWLAFVVLMAALRIAGVLLFFVPVLGHLLVFLLSMVVALGFVILWMVLVVKALQGEMFKLPLVGEYAEQQAGK